MKRTMLFLGALLLTAQSFAATLYIEEFSDSIPVTRYQAAVAPGIAKQTVAIGGSSTQSSAFNASTRLIRVHTDSICSVEVGGTSPTATTTSMRMVAGQTEYFLVTAGDKLAVITNT